MAVAAMREIHARCGCHIQLFCGMNVSCSALLLQSEADEMGGYMWVQMSMKTAHNSINKAFEMQPNRS